MSKRDRVHGDDQDIDAPYEQWTLPEILNLKRNRRDFAEEVHDVETATAPYYESRNVQGE